MTITLELRQGHICLVEAQVEETFACRISRQHGPRKFTNLGFPLCFNFTSALSFPKLLWWGILKQSLILLIILFLNVTSWKKTDVSGYLSIYRFSSLSNCQFCGLIWIVKKLVYQCRKFIPEVMSSMSLTTTVDRINMPSIKHRLMLKHF